MQSGSYLGDYSSFIYIIVGVAFYIVIKALADRKAANGSAYLRYDATECTLQIQDHDIDAAIIGAMAANDSSFMIAGMPVTLGEIRMAANLALPQDELVNRIAMRHSIYGQLVSNEEAPRSQMLLRAAYENAVKTGEFLLSGGNNILERNRIFEMQDIKKGDLQAKKKRKPLLVAAFGQADSRRIEWLSRQYHPGNGIFRFRLLDRTARCYDVPSVI